jgi:hypothetical protein
MIYKILIRGMVGKRMIDEKRVGMRCEQRDIYTNQREENVAEDRGTKSDCCLR